MVLDWNLEAFSSLVAICPCEHFTEKACFFARKVQWTRISQTTMLPCCTVTIDLILLLFPDVAMCLHISGTPPSIQNAFRNTGFLGGGLKYFENFHPEHWGRGTQFDSYVSKGLVQPPTRERMALFGCFRK